MVFIFFVICWPDNLGLTQDNTWDKKNTSFTKHQNVVVALGVNFKHKQSKKMEIRDGDERGKTADYSIIVRRMKKK